MLAFIYNLQYIMDYFEKLMDLMQVVFKLLKQKI